jgi:hypothetical protein
MISSDEAAAALRARARELVAQGYERMSIVDGPRAKELAALYEELGNQVVVLKGAVPPDDAACDVCLIGPGVFTLFVRKR